MRRPPLPSLDRLTPDQFKALAKFKGWTYRWLAQRWGIEPESLSAISRNPNRSIRYDDMLRGMPNLRQLARDQRRFAEQLAAAMEAHGPQPAEVRPLAVQGGPGFRFHGYLERGSIVAATCDVGEIALEGDRGVVFNVQVEAQREIYGIIFESGQFDWLTPESIESYVAGIGLTDEGTTGYSFEDNDQLIRDFHSGHFTFWPVIPD